MMSMLETFPESVKEVCGMEICTIRDVARRAGVAVSTVSRVLNGKKDVSEATRKRVLEVVEAFGYVQNGNARFLKQDRSEFAVIIVRGRRSVFLSDAAERMLAYAQGGKTPFFTEYIDETDDEFDVMRHLYAQKRAGAFIFLGSRLDERCEAVRAMGVPCVFATVDATVRDFGCASSVSIDDRAAACAVMNGLIEKGHKRIAIFGGNPEGDDPIARRYQGAVESISSHGMAFDPQELFCQVRFSLDGAYESAKAYFASHPDVTAVFAMSDTIAAGVIRALHDLGRAVPQDVSVAGFDGTQMAKYFIPSIATVSQPVEDIARESVALLLELIAGGDARHVTVDYRLVDGESVAARK